MTTYTEEDMKLLSETLTAAWKAIAWASVGFTALFYSMVILFIYGIDSGTEPRYLIVTGLFSMGLFGCWSIWKYTKIRYLELGWIK